MSRLTMLRAVQWRGKLRLLLHPHLGRRRRRLRQVPFL